MSKSIQWDFKNSIGANTLGRNTHYEVDAYIEKSEAQKKEVFAKGGYWNDPQAVSLKKSEGEKADLNDLIEKGYTQSAQQIKRIQDLQNHKPDGIVLKKSFSDRELAAALGMDEKAYRAFMGSED